MAWSSPDGWPTRLFSGDPIAILLAFLTTISLPILLHLYFYTTSARAELAPTFLLLGPSGSGKSSLLSLLQGTSSDKSRGPSPTRTSQVSSDPLSLQLPASVQLGSNKYRSAHDDSSNIPTSYKAIDTPGHGKLRSAQGLAFLSDPALKGIIFMIDAASLEGTDSSGIRDAATYLHDTLLALQRQSTAKSSKSKKTAGIPILVAANKQDLFTALPPGAVRERLEREIERVRTSRSRGLVTVGDDTEEEPEDALGGNGEGKFSFKMLKEDYGLQVDVIGGAVGGDEAGKGVRRWEEWIGGCL